MRISLKNFTGKDFDKDSISEMMELVSYSMLFENGLNELMGTEEFKESCEKCFGFRGFEGVESDLREDGICDNITEIVIMIASFGIAEGVEGLQLGMKGVASGVSKGAGWLLSKLPQKVLQKIPPKVLQKIAPAIASTTASAVSGAVTMGGYTFTEGVLTSLLDRSKKLDDMGTWQDVVNNTYSSAGFGAFAGVWGKLVVSPVVAKLCKTSQKALLCAVNSLKGGAEVSGKELMLSTLKSGEFSFKSFRSLSKDEIKVLAAGFEDFSKQFAVSTGTEAVGFTGYETLIELACADKDPVSGKAIEDMDFEEFMSYLGRAAGHQVESLATFKGIGMFLFMRKGGRIGQKLLMENACKDCQMLENFRFKEVKENGKIFYEMTTSDGQTKRLNSINEVLAVCNRTLMIDMMLGQCGINTAKEPEVKTEVVNDGVNKGISKEANQVAKGKSPQSTITQTPQSAKTETPWTKIETNSPMLKLKNTVEQQIKRCVNEVDETGFGTETFYDKNDRVIKTVFHDFDGSTHETYIGYDNSNNIIFKMEKHASGEIETRQYTSVKNEHKLKELSKYKDGSYENIKYEYDKKGNLIKEIKSSNGKDATEIKIYEYDENNNLILEKTNYPESDGCEAYNIINAEYHYDNNKLSSYVKYNNQTNTTEHCIYNEDGSYQKIIEKSGKKPSYTISIYDKNSKLIKSVYVENKLPSEKFEGAKAKTVYRSSENRINRLRLLVKTIDNAELKNYIEKSLNELDLKDYQNIDSSLYELEELTDAYCCLNEKYVNLNNEGLKTKDYICEEFIFYSFGKITDQGVKKELKSILSEYLQHKNGSFTSDDILKDINDKKNNILKSKNYSPTADKNKLDNLTALELLINFNKSKNPKFESSFKQNSSKFSDKECWDDITETLKIESLFNYCISGKNSEWAKKLYKAYVEKLNVSNTTKQQLTDIEQKYGTKVFISKHSAEASVEFISKELELWKQAGGNNVKFPTALSNLQADSYFFKSRSIGYASPVQQCIALCGERGTLHSNNTLRHEMTHLNDHLINVENNELFNSIKSNRKYSDELAAAGVIDIYYAYTNKKEFIAVASQGDFSKYSPEFKKVLVELGMPEWELNLPFISETSNAQGAKPEKTQQVIRSQAPQGIKAKAPGQPVKADDVVIMNELMKKVMKSDDVGKTKYEIINSSEFKNLEPGNQNTLSDMIDNFARIKYITGSNSTDAQSLLAIRTKRGCSENAIKNLYGFLQKYPKYKNEILEIVDSNQNIKFGQALDNSTAGHIDEIVKLIETNPNYKDLIVDYIKVQRRSANDTTNPTEGISVYIETLNKYPEHRDFITELSKNGNLDAKSTDGGMNTIEVALELHTKRGFSKEDILILSKQNYSIPGMRNSLYIIKEYPEMRNIVLNGLPEYKLIDAEPAKTPRDIIENRYKIKENLEKLFPQEMNQLKQTLGDDFFFKVRWEEIIPANTSNQNIKSILNNLNESSKFFARTNINESKYGKNIQWASKMNDISDEAVFLISKGKDFKSVLDYIARQYHFYDESKTLDTNIEDNNDRRTASGIYRGFDESHGQYITPFYKKGSYEEYFDKLAANARTDANANARKKPYDDINLTNILYFEGNEDGLMCHPKEQYVEPGMRHVQNRYEELQPLFDKVKTGQKLTQQDIALADDKISEIYFLMANIMPYRRGSNGISDILIRSIYKSLGINQPALKHGVSLDLEAFSMDLDVYKKNWNSFFETK